MATKRRRRKTRARPESEQHAPTSVHGLHVLPDGPSFVFEEFRLEGHPVRMITIGADPAQDIALTEDSMVSEAHCLLERTSRGWRVRDCNSTNGTRANDVDIQSCILHPGCVLELGQTRLVAFGPDGFSGEMSIVVGSMFSIVHRTFEIFDGYGRSAEQLGIPRSTFVDWLKKRFRVHPRRGEQP